MSARETDSRSDVSFIPEPRSEKNVSENGISPENLQYVEQLYEEWRKNRNAVSSEWDRFFSGAGTKTPDQPAAPAPSPQNIQYKQGRVESLIWAYRDVGYLYARLNPLVGYYSADLLYMNEQDQGIYETLTLREFGLDEGDLDTVFSSGRVLQPSRAPLRDIIQSLRETYCSSIGIEFLHIQNKKMRKWIIEKMETTHGKPVFGAERKKMILEDLVRAEEFEHFLHSQFIGQKRFSLEGAEVLIPALHFLVDVSVDSAIEDIVIGMSHRGRLNVLANILNKPIVEVFSEFEDIFDPSLYGGSGDVKYHRGYQLDHVHENGNHVMISLVPNPSHLESVDPVVQGIARGIQQKKKDLSGSRVIPILIHGDAAFSGQGVVAETLNLSQLKGYSTSGTIHIIINNQIGFTTSTKDARSTFFPTDIGKMLHIPILHVNSDDPEAVVHAAQLAFEFRRNFRRDVIIDIVCYRRHGHNEGDEPSFTHPKMYERIKYHTSTTHRYLKVLDETGVLQKEEAELFARRFRDSLKEDLQKIKSEKISTPRKIDSRLHSSVYVDTGVEQRVLEKIVDRITAIPQGFHMHRKLERIVGDRAHRLENGGQIDFSLAEALAFGSLLLEGVHVRLSGEDSARGTFSQRHAMWWDTQSSHPVSYVPLNHLEKNQAEFAVYDSPLSEFSVLGFEYGYALARTDTLVLWEAQFGDFCNGAQVIIDNYIVSGESKWQVKNGIVLLLPHGYEGQGPEHSSAHLERFLQLCANNNIKVCFPTTPAQYFHLLRSHVKDQDRKPLIIMTPKSLLRSRNSVSQIGELSGGKFQKVIEDADAPTGAKNLFFCSGKIYYDLLKKRKEIDDCALIRIEQLYPFPADEILRILTLQKEQKSVFWVQEETQNRGAWTYIQNHFLSNFGNMRVHYIGRKEGASPATGSHRLHQQEQQSILQTLLQSINQRENKRVESALSDSMQ